MILKDKRIALYVTGGIAIYKVVDFMRSLIKEGAQVRVAMTDAATKFVSPLTFQVLSKHKVYIDTFSEDNPSVVSHIDLADWADLSIIAPATANTLAKLAHGIGDNIVTTALLATDGPIFIIPAMNNKMFHQPATVDNLATLRNRGCYIVEPDIGFLAEGYEGKGRYPENQRILQELHAFAVRQTTDLALKGKKIVVTAGGTKERIDPVRFITNDSSGKMGYAIAQAAFNQGADVSLITSSDLPVPSYYKSIKVSSTEEMLEAVRNEFHDANALVMSAAVSDYKVKNPAKQKMKKKENITLEFEKNPDILKEMAKEKQEQILVGFAAETENIEEYALKKLREKSLDFIVANDVGKKDRGFNVDKNEVTIYSKDKEPVIIQLDTKVIIANKIVDELISRMN